MKRALSKSSGVTPSKVKKINADSVLSLGQTTKNKRIVFTSNSKLEEDHRPVDMVSERLIPEPSSKSDESDEEGAPAVCSLKVFKDKTQTALLEQEKKVKDMKLKEIEAKKEARAYRHQRNLKQKMEKTERAKELEALMLDQALVQDTNKLLEAQHQTESSEDGYGTRDGEDGDDGCETAFEGTRTVFQEDNIGEVEDIFSSEVSAPKNGVHVVSLETTEDYKLQKAIEFKNRMFFGAAVQRMPNDSYKRAEDKRRAKKSVQMARNMRLAKQQL